MRIFFFAFIEKTVWYSLYHRMINLGKWIRTGPECGTAHEDGCLDPTLRHPKTKTLWKPNQFTFWISKQWRQFSVIFFVFEYKLHFCWQIHMFVDRVPCLNTHFVGESHIHIDPLSPLSIYFCCLNPILVG